MDVSYLKIWGGVQNALQMGITLIGFAEDLCYSLPSFQTFIFYLIFHVQTEFHFFFVILQGVNKKMDALPDKFAPF